ncbi:tyrosine recombinase XerC [Paenibacillus antibioticophila]|uniref:Tyrosine recombinase XerC n=1 Tax=Paenibacillus antibioticophila TaxID=1274374 RepID=A0A919XXU3_9BACL|nr:tyrosine-type recombinase/integrase [Paenibacillus antibioticophila]GIO38835.1 tyrosine recombinase XerC [Paenibacillus antibioticophila]
MKIVSAVDLFLQHLVDEEKSDKTVKAYGMCMNHFVAWIGSSWDEITELEDVTQTVVRDFKSFLESKVDAKTKRQLAPTTVNHYLIALRSFLLFARGRGVVFKSDPVAAIKLKVIANQNETKWLTNEEIAKISHVIELLKHAGEKRKALYKAIFAILVNCGLRVAEVADLKVSDVLLDSGLLIVRSGKGKKYRHVPLGVKTRAIIQAWLDHHNGHSPHLFYSQRDPKMTARAIQHMMGRLSRLSKIPFTVHQLRHTFAKRVANESGQIEVVATVLGHANIQTTRRYIEPSIHEIRKVVEGVEFE